MLINFEKNPFNHSMSVEPNITVYASKRDKELYIGKLLIPTTSLSIDPSFQRPYSREHAERILPLWDTGDVDHRSTSSLDCVVPIEQQEQVMNWVASQDPEKIKAFNPNSPLVFDLPNCSFPIVKGQHRYKAYCIAIEKHRIPEDAPYPGHLCVDLYYSGVLYAV